MSGMELLTAIFSIVQGIVANIMSHSDAGGTVTELPSEIVDKIEAVGMLESIPLWIVTLLGSLLITVLSFVMILTVYGRMFKLYMYTAIAPIPLATFAGEPTQSVGRTLSVPTPGYVWKVPSSHWLASSFRCLRRVCRPSGIPVCLL